jgi:6-pyruvoyl-tetrahydropterin synthase
MVCDFLVVKELIGDYLEALDHAICVNTADRAYPGLGALVRNVALLLRDDPRISSFEVQAVKQESIHAHDAVARVIWKRGAQRR